jgi:hypothetical protein
MAVYNRCGFLMSKFPFPKRRSSTNHSATLFDWRIFFPTRYWWIGNSVPSLPERSRPVARFHTVGARLHAPAAVRWVLERGLRNSQFRLQRTSTHTHPHTHTHTHTHTHIMPKIKKRKAMNAYLELLGGESWDTTTTEKED